MTFLLYGKECVSIQWGNHRNLSDLRRGTQVAMVCINERTKGAIKKKKSTEVLLMEFRIEKGYSE